MKKILTIIIALTISLCVSAQNYDVIEPELQKILNQKSNDKISVNIVLSSQADNTDLNVKFDDIKDKTLKREKVIKELKDFSSENQNKVMSFLQAEIGNDNVSDLKAHWLVNTINCVASRDVIYRLSEQPGISVIGYNEKTKLISDSKPQPTQQTRGLVDNITKVGADQVWAAGYTGKDVIVAVLDSGVNSEHVDLADHLWDGGYDYPDHGWNFIDNNYITDDYNGHGTHCAGTICGDGTSGTQTGMAPDATLMSVKVLNDEGEGTLEALVSGVEFAVENGADILSISLGWTLPNASVSTVMREMFENVLATGVVAAVAAGNERDGIDTIPIPRNINAPGNCPPPWLHPDQQANPGGLSAVVSVGAVDYYDTAAYFTSQGPVTWQSTQWGDYPYDYELNIDENWLYYDDGFVSTGIGGPESFYWGVMFPTSTLQQYEGNTLTKVAFYDIIETTTQLLIYYGGDYSPETLVHVQDCQFTGTNSMVEIELSTALPINENKNLWIVMYTEDGASYPASCSDNTGDPNGRWLSSDGTTWNDIIDYGLYYTWILRAYVTNDNGMSVTELKPISDYEYKPSSKGILTTSGLRTSQMSVAASENNFGLIRPDVCAPGVEIVSSAYDSNDGTLTFSGTSMATPCVAGVMALMLNKDPNLTPADICRILETTATPLESKKSNLTGSGRINAYMAINEIDNIKEETPTTPITPSYRNVLIEEFTGRLCNFCPMGHGTINQIMDDNPGKVFAVNYHTQTTLSPTSYPNLNVSESAIFFNAFGISGIPSAVINRSGEAIHSINASFSVEAQLSQLAEVNIDGQVVIDEATRTATITVEAYYTSNSASSTNYLTIMMLQDSIFGSQSGGEIYNPSQVVNGEYCHMHTLRDIITSTWGDAIAPTTAGTFIKKQYVYNIPEIIGSPNGVEVDLDNIYFLAFITEKKDGTPTQPVLNVNKLEKFDGEEETSNYWTPDESLYANNMTVITTVQIDGEEQYNPNLELGAFCNGELRGSSRLQYVDYPANRYECFLMIYGNSGDNITFQLYDHRTGTISDLKANESISFEVNATVGDITNPFTVNFVGTIAHSKQLSSGWNWYSTYILNEGEEGLSNMEAALGNDGIQIKNQTKFVNYASGNWYGTLTGTAVEDMYMIQMSAAHNLELEGYVVNPADYPITLGTNWKWISYPLASEISVEEAFAGAYPSNGDYVKSQTGFAQYYDGLGWSGTLKTMTPGMGYMYQNKSGYSKTLVYPNASGKSAIQTQSTEPTFWTADVTKYPMNMTIIATVDGVASDYEVAAFCNGECRGNARPIYIKALDRYMLFLTVYGNDNDNITFRYYNVNNENVIAINENMTFAVNATYGDMMEPYVMTMATTGIDKLSSGIMFYPTPVNDKLYIETEVEIKEVAVYTITGVMVGQQTTDNRQQTLSIDVTNLNSGVYFVKIVTDNGEVVKRFVKK